MTTPATGPALVRQLSEWLVGTGITLLDLRTPTGSIRLVRAGDGVAASAAGPTAAVPPSAVSVLSPAVGVFLDRHPMRATPLAAPLATLGQAVRAGDVVALLQVGSLLLHVRAPADATVIEVLRPAGSTVGYGAALLRLQRSVVE